MGTVEENWEAMKQTAMEKLREVMSRRKLPPNWHDLSWMIDDFCKQPAPTSTSELAHRSLQLNRIFDTIP